MLRFATCLDACKRLIAIDASQLNSKYVWMQRCWSNAFATKSRYGAKADVWLTHIWTSSSIDHPSQLQNLSIALARLSLAIPPVYYM